MAARKVSKDGAALRQKIKAVELIACLTAHVKGRAEMSATQIRAAEILLRKCLPDLGTTHLDEEGGIATQIQRIERAIVDRKA
jgi:hypothetical protein